VLKVPFLGMKLIYCDFFGLGVGGAVVEDW